MEKNHGFSMTEVLISIFLVASISLVLLKEQMQVNLILFKSIKHAEFLIESANNLELKKSGFSILELFITLLLASLLISGLLQQYIQTKRQYIFVKKQFEKEIELQFVSQLMRNSIRKAGFTPCLSINHLKAFDNRDRLKRLQALTYEEDRISINRMSDDFITLPTISGQQQIKLPSKLKRFKNIILADCYHAEVQTVEVVIKNKYEQIVRLQKPLAFKYQPPIYLGEWVEESFFIKTNNKGIGSINYHREHTEELSALIHTMAVKISASLVHLTLGLDDKKSYLVTRLPC